MPAPSDKKIVDTLVDVLSLALSHGCLDEAQAALQALRVLRPTKRELDTFEAWIAVRRKDWHQAMRVLHDLEISLPDWEFGKTLLAFCQHATGDPAWTQRAHQLAAHSQNPDTLQLMQLLLHPEAAMLASSNTSGSDPAALGAALLQRV